MHTTTSQNKKKAYIFLINKSTQQKTATQQHNTIIHDFFTQNHVKHKHAINHTRANLMQK